MELVKSKKRAPTCPGGTCPGCKRGKGFLGRDMQNRSQGSPFFKRRAQGVGQRSGIDPLAKVREFMNKVSSKSKGERLVSNQENDLMGA